MFKKQIVLPATEQIQLLPFLKRTPRRPARWPSECVANSAIRPIFHSLKAKNKDGEKNLLREMKLPYRRRVIQTPDLLRVLGQGAPQKPEPASFSFENVG